MNAARWAPLLPSRIVPDRPAGGLGAPLPGRSVAGRVLIGTLTTVCTADSRLLIITSSPGRQMQTLGSQVGWIHFKSLEIGSHVCNGSVVSQKEKEVDLHMDMQISRPATLSLNTKQQ